MAICRSNGELYISQNFNDTIMIFNSHNFHRIGGITLPNSQSFILVDPFTGDLFALLPELNKVAVMNTKNDSVMYFISVGCAPISASLDPSNGKVFVTNAVSNSVSVIDPYSQSVSQTYHTGRSPKSSVFDEKTCSLYVANSLGSWITVINITNNVSGRISFSEPSSLVISNNDDFLYVQNRSCSVTVVNLLNDQMSTYNISGYPYGLFKNMENGNVYDETFSDIAVVFRNGSEVPDCYIILPSEGCMAFPAQSHAILISEEAGGVLHLLNQKKMYLVDFREEGLPPHTGWYVDITDHWMSSKIKQNHVSVPLLNGTYTYMFQSSSRVYVSSSHRTVVINGSNITIMFLFTRMYYAVTFIEEGIARGATWCENTGGITHVISGNSYTTYLTNGSYETYASVCAGSFRTIPASYVVMGRNINVIFHFPENKPPSSNFQYVFIVTLATISLIAVGIYFVSRKR
jgi:40-residue YVTN family beta-propeller repeat